MRKIPADLVQRYEAEGWWAPDTLGDLLARGLAAAPGATFRVHSEARPWAGTFWDVERVARRLAGGLRARGVGPGDLVAFQLPNWMEAAAVFWASAFLGAAVVPIVHFYGRKEVGYILNTITPRVFITAERFGRLEYQPDLCAGVPIVGVVRPADAGGSLPGAASFGGLLSDDPMPGTRPADPADPALIAFTSGTTADPKGVVHSHQTLGFETHQLAERFPPERGAQLTAASVGHFIGMVNSVLIPVLDGTPVNFTDVWNPAGVLALMRSHGLTVGGGALYFLTSLLDHPDFTARDLERMKYAGPGGGGGAAGHARHRGGGGRGRPGRAARRARRSLRPDDGRASRARSGQTAGAFRPVGPGPAEVAGGAVRGGRLPADRERQGPEVPSPSAHCGTRGQPPVRDPGSDDQVPAQAVPERDPVRAAERAYQDRDPRSDQRVHPQSHVRGGRPAGRDGAVLRARQPEGKSRREIDCVLYMPLLGDVGDLCRLLASGANVVTTAGVFHHPPSLDPAVRAQVEAACQRGGSSIHSTGSSPGLISEAVPLVLTSIQRRLDAMIIEEFADLSARDTPELLFGLMGFGQPAMEMDPRRVAHAKMSFGPSLRQVAGTLSIPLDDVTASGEVATARRAVRIAAGPLPAGTVAAQRLTVSGVRDGQPVLTFRATWYCTPDLDPAWDTRVSGWHLAVEGDAPLDIDIRFPVPLDQMAFVFPAYTANRAVNAVPYVCAAPPGIHTTADLPQIVARLT